MLRFSTLNHFDKLRIPLIINFLLKLFQVLFGLAIFFFSLFFFLLFLHERFILGWRHRIFVGIVEVLIEEHVLLGIDIGLIIGEAHDIADLGIDVAALIELRSNLEQIIRTFLELDSLA